MKKFEEVYESVKRKLSDERIYHSECVMKRAVELAKLYGEDVEKARLVGIAHDILKETPKSQRIEEAEKLGVHLDDIEKRELALIHAKSGAEFCKIKFGFSEDMCDAIRYHSTGRANMTLLDKIIYLADATSEDRKYKEAGIAYELAKKDLNMALVYFFKKTMGWLIDDEFHIHPNTVDAYNFYLKK